jgi:hypothetical protein
VVPDLLQNVGGGCVIDTPNVVLGGNVLDVSRNDLVPPDVVLGASGGKMCVLVPDGSARFLGWRGVFYFDDGLEGVGELFKSFLQNLPSC